MFSFSLQMDEMNLLVLEELTDDEDILAYIITSECNHLLKTGLSYYN